VLAPGDGEQQSRYFLSYYVGASEQHLPRARTSVLQGAEGRSGLA
jgi:hypothetical protein